MLNQVLGGLTQYSLVRTDSRVPSQLQQSDNRVPLEFDCPGDYEAQKVGNFLCRAVRLVNFVVPFTLALVHADKKLIEHLNKMLFAPVLLDVPDALPQRRTGESVILIHQVLKHHRFED